MLRVQKAAMANQSNTVPKKWTIFIMCHNVIWDELYAFDSGFDSRHYTFIKLGRQNLKYNSHKGYKIISERDCPIYLDLPHYAELTGLYCIYKNRLHDGLDYVGASHYDKEHRLIGDGSHRNMQELDALRLEADIKRRVLPGSKTNLTELIETQITQRQDVHISLESHDVQKIYDQRITMDERYPDMFVGNGVNCIDRILQDYNDFFGTRYTWEDLKKCDYLTMCNCFLTPVWLFEKLMTFICPIIESRSLDIFDTKRKHRLQGGLLERYVAVFFALEKIKTVDLSTVHQPWRKIRPGFLKKILSRVIGR
jgi:hypothetical protein